jgi:hypothetical protein
VADDIIDQLSWFVTNEIRMPAGLIVTVISHIEAQQAEIKRLRTAGDALAVAYRTLGGLDVAHDSALRAWEEARREQ